MKISPIAFGQRTTIKKEAVFVALYLEEKIYQRYEGLTAEQQNTPIPIVLMLNRFDGQIGFLGGTVEIGESLEVALKRELLEESGYNLTPDDIKNLQAICSHEADNVVTHLYALKISAKTLKEIFSHQHKAEHFLCEGTLIAPHFINYPHINAFDNFMNNNFALTVIDEIPELIKTLKWESKYNLSLDRIKFDPEIEEFKNKIIEEQEERLALLIKHNDYEKFLVLMPHLKALRESFLLDIFKTATLNNNQEIVVHLAEKYKDYYDIKNMKHADYFVEILTDCCYKGFVEIAKLLIDEGCHLYRSHLGALGCAILSNNQDLINYILNKDYDIHYKGESALRCAINTSNKELIEELLKRGADLHIDNGRMIKDLLSFTNIKSLEILVNNHFDVLHYNEEYGLLAQALEYDNLIVLEFLLEKGCRLSQEQKDSTDNDFEYAQDAFKFMDSWLAKNELENNLMKNKTATKKRKI